MTCPPVYRKAPTISPGLIYFCKEFLMGLYTGGLIFGREGAYSQRFTVYVKRGPDTPTKKPASGQCPRPFLSLPCGISLNQAMRLSVVFGLKCNLVWQVLFLFCSIMADVEDLVSSKKKSNTKRKANMWCSAVNCSKSNSITLSHMLLAICSISVHKNTATQPAKKSKSEMIWMTIRH